MIEVIVCGGGPSLFEDLKQCPKDAIKISCNHHAAQVINCEYTLYWHKFVEDEIEGIKTERIYAKNYKGKKIRIFGYTGTAAINFALDELKADKVYITGIDLYTGETKYFHGDGPRTGNHWKGLKYQLVWWNHLLNHIGDNVNKLHPISGPLIELCKQRSAVAH